MNFNVNRTVNFIFLCDSLGYVYRASLKPYLGWKKDKYPQHQVWCFQLIALSPGATNSDTWLSRHANAVFVTDRGLDRDGSRD